MHSSDLRGIHPKLGQYAQLVYGLAEILGNDCEVLLHDVSRLERSIVACANGHVTGRSLGSPMSVYGLELLNSGVFAKPNDVHTYIARANNGKLIKCGVIALRDGDGEIIGLLCIHFDTTRALAAREFIDSLVSSGGDAGSEPVNEFFGLEMDDVFNDVFREIKGLVDKPISELSKSQKKIIIKNLMKRGFFLMKGAVEYIAGEMGNSKFTIYGYIREIEKGGGDRSLSR
ncbi:MAG: PAS domain-containing protein [Synergistaceae bacterium]|jgi:predicted transcriptional regulator YheO|nr:PAS domain-containing protein [Synergistaceae bacterium]